MPLTRWRDAYQALKGKPLAEQVAGLEHLLAQRPRELCRQCVRDTVLHLHVLKQQLRRVR